MADRMVVLNHALCFIFSKIHRDDEKKIKNCVINFYSDEAISAARDMLLDYANTTDITLPRLPGRRNAGDGRTQRELKDIFDIIDTLDSAMALDQLPKFTSDDPVEMPSSNLTEGDMRAIMDRLDKLDARMEAMTVQVTMFSGLVQRLAQPSVNTGGESRDSRSLIKSTVGPASAATVARPAVNTSVSALAKPGAQAAVKVNTVVQPTAGPSSVALPSAISSAKSRHGESYDESAAADSEPYTEVLSKSGRKRRRVRSKNNSPDEPNYTTDDADDESAAAVAVKTVHVSYASKAAKGKPLVVGKKRDIIYENAIAIGIVAKRADKIAAAKPYLSKSVFCVDNVSTDVSVDEMTQFIDQLGVRVISCNNVPPRRPMWQRRRGIKPKDRRTFRVCIPRDDCDKFLDEDMWPEHISVSRWIFAKNPRPRRDDIALNENDDQSNRSPLGQQWRGSLSALTGGATVAVSNGSSVSATAAAAVGGVGTPRLASTDRRQQADGVTPDSAENLNDTITDHHGGN